MISGENSDMGCSVSGKGLAAYVFRVCVRLSFLLPEALRIKVVTIAPIG